MICNLCPRNCNALRTDTEGSGLCAVSYTHLTLPTTRLV